MASATGIISLSISFVDIAANVIQLIRTVKGFNKRRADLERKIELITNILKEFSEINNSADGKTCRMTVEELESCMDEILKFLRKLGGKSRCGRTFKSRSIKRKFDTFNEQLLTKHHIFQSQLQVATLAAMNKTQGGKLPNNDEQIRPVTGLTDTVLKEIADNLETDDQMESLARALGQTRTQISQCHTTDQLTGSVTTRGTVQMLTAWKATVPPENQMSSMRSAMTSARLISLRDTVLVKAEKQLEQKRQDYQKDLQRQQHQEHCQHESSLDSLSSMKTSEVDHAFSSLHSVDIRTTSSTGIHMDGRRTVESKQRSASPCQPSNSPTSGSLQIQQEYYDIYLVFSQETKHVRKVKDIIQRNGWTVMTAAESRLGVSKMMSIQNALKTCSHVVLIITKEDCEKNDPHQTMTIEMAFQSTFDGSLESRVISIRCCDESCLPLELRSLTNACISDAYLEERLKRSINVSIRKRRKERLSSGSDDCSHLSPSSTQAVTSPSNDTSQRTTNSTRTGNNSTLPTEGATSIAPSATFDTSIQPLTAAQVALQIEQLIPRMNEVQAGPSCLLNIQGNVYNIGSMQYAGRPDDVPQHPMVIPPAVRHELSKRLNGSRVTHDDWRGLACKLGLDGYIDSLDRRPDPTSDVIGLAEKQKKLCSLEDLRGILVSMKRDDCVEALDGYENDGVSVELINRLMIRERDRESSSSDDF